MIVTTTGVSHLPLYSFVVLPDGKTEKIQGTNETNQISTLHLNINVSAEIDGVEVSLRSLVGTCGSACRIIANKKWNNEEGKSLVEILRFAKSGRSEYKPKGFKGAAIWIFNLFKRIKSFFDGTSYKAVGFDWLIIMEDGFNLKGWATTDLSSSGKGKLKLGGRMVIKYQTDFEKKPSNLRSRIEPKIAGDITQWPPKNEIIKLTNGPINYYHEHEVNDPNAKPVLHINTNEVIFENSEAEILAITPEIFKVEKVDSETKKGLKIKWSNTSNRVTSGCSVDIYNIYRRYNSSDNEEGSEWVKIAMVPKHITEWVDSNYDSSVPTTYAILHATRLNFNYYYESLVGSTLHLAPKVLI